MVKGVVRPFASYRVEPDPNGTRFTMVGSIEQLTVAGRTARALRCSGRERIDGSGYPRGLAGAAIGLPARLLAAADVYQAMVERRPHRPALTPDDAAVELRREARAGRLDGDAVEAILIAAGHRSRTRRERPAGLTAREVEVLQLLAQGLSSREIAAALVISPKTARNHIEHIYVKIGAKSRVTASLFAVKHGLLGDPAT